ncbi:MAG: DUF3419 family protein [Candidatus Tritonobacter lacicola]|nr:DUF3419 family protein [Candidatus Tritonobacter lacicola]
MKRLDHRVQFDFIRYANCWEDADILREALNPAPGKRILSVASGGDNSFALLADGAEVVATDMSAPQVACVEIKAAAIRKLDHGEVLSFLGVRPSKNRLAVYELVKSDISKASRDYWDRNQNSITGGIIHAGKFENYFRLFRTCILPLIHSRRKVARLLEPRVKSDRHDFYNSVWNNLRWRLLFRVFFGRFVMGRLGRDPEFFRHVEGSVSDRILQRTRHALTELPTDQNPYLDYILNGNFTRCLPPYLEAERFDRLRDSLERLTICREPVEKAALIHRGRGFDGFNLSDIFEYLDAGTCSTIYGELLGAARPGARLAYWNMLVPRSCPREFNDRVTPLADISGELLQRDRAFFYTAFVVEEVKH